MKIEKWLQYCALSLHVLLAAGSLSAMVVTAPSTAGAQTKTTEPFPLSTLVDALKKSVGVLPDSEIAAAVQQRGVYLIDPNGRTRGF